MNSAAYETSGKNSSRFKDDFRTLGVLNEVPTLENIKPLLQLYADWMVEAERNWNLYTLEENTVGGVRFTLHWVLHIILQDPTIDPLIIRYVLDTFPKNFVIACVYNPVCPEDLIERLIKSSGTKTDPTRSTKGGEVTCFILHKATLPSSLVDECARKTRKASNQQDVIKHPNVSQDTLVFLSREGKSESVKRNALRELVKRGYLMIA